VTGESQKPGRLGQYRLFSLSGFEVKLDLSWLLLALLITWSLGAGVFPEEYPDLPRRVYAWMGIACAIGVFFSIVFHEFSHSMVARQFGLPIKGITLFIFGGVAEMEEEPPNPRSEFLMAAAGPLASFLLAFLFTEMESLAVAKGWPVSFVGVFDKLALINFVVAIFNLVPAFPLDGGRMLRAALWKWKNDMRVATHISSRIGSAFGLGLMLLGGFSFFQGNFIGGMWWFLIGLFLRGAATASYQQLLLKEVLREKPVKDFMRRNPVTVAPSVTVQDWIDDYVYQHHFKMFPVVDNSGLLGCVSTNRIKQIPRAEWRDKTVGEVMDRVSDANSVPASTETTKLLSTMIRPNTASRFMVVEDGQLVGMISLKDLQELIALKLEIESPGK
jgi:Zn-dependent protease/predicted transcriptional regulator